MIKRIIDNQVATLLEIIARLEFRIVKLERKLGLHSGNSSKTPSSDGLKKPPRMMCLREKGLKAEILRFSIDFAVPFTNNRAEQDIRMMKIRQLSNIAWREKLRHASSNYL